MFNLERNGPIVAREMAEYAKQWDGLFVAAIWRYRGERTVLVHKTGAQAVRALSSLIRGKRRVRDGYCAAIVTPCGRVMSRNEARTAFRRIN